MSAPRYDQLLLWVLWKLQGTKPVTITGDDVIACRRAFSDGGPALFVDGPGTSVEVRVTSHDDAIARREFAEAQSGSTQ